MDEGNKIVREITGVIEGDRAIVSKGKIVLFRGRKRKVEPKPEEPVEKSHMGLSTSKTEWTGRVRIDNNGHLVGVYKERFRRPEPNHGYGEGSVDVDAKAGGQLHANAHRMGMVGHLTNMLGPGIMQEAIKRGGPEHIKDSPEGMNQLLSNSVHIAKHPGKYTKEHVGKVLDNLTEHGEVNLVGAVKDVVKEHQAGKRFKFDPGHYETEQPHMGSIKGATLEHEGQSYSVGEAVPVGTNKRVMAITAEDGTTHDLHLSDGTYSVHPHTGEPQTKAGAMVEHSGDEAKGGEAHPYPALQKYTLLSTFDHKDKKYTVASTGLLNGDAHPRILATPQGWKHGNGAEVFKVRDDGKLDHERHIYGYEQKAGTVKWQAVTPQGFDYDSTHHGDLTPVKPVKKSGTYLYFKKPSAQT